MTITFKNNERKAVINYLAAKAEKAAAEKKEKAAKAELKDLFSRMGSLFKSTDKTAYIYGTIQENGKACAVVYKETTAKGTIDWQAYALSIGGNIEDAESFRKADNIRTSFDYATTKEIKEIGLV